MTAKAVFLDRDGVINRNVYYESSGEWESPRTADDLDVLPWVAPALRKLMEGGFLLFVVSNQPSHAKGKTTLGDLLAVHERLASQLEAEGIDVAEFLYCFHHPHGVVPEFTTACECRKPSPHFVLKTIEAYGLDPRHSWMVGDRDSDIECGSAAGVRTIQIEPDHQGAKARKAAADFRVETLREAVAVILG
jgi:D-glycero-D-manno-heptose 1,7-bisphosphate phosphatase